jgi:prepilin-type N-terminal cleavage/methylation domain-containing protein/prepilin-type processing-associated H-X9-DG protein
MSKRLFILPSPTMLRTYCRITNRTGFTLVEMLVTIAILSVLAVLLISSEKSIVASSKQVKCHSNLRQLGAGLLLACNENGGKLPWLLNGDSEPATFWHAMEPYIESKWREGFAFSDGVWRCPMVTDAQITAILPGNTYWNLGGYGVVEGTLFTQPNFGGNVHTGQDHLPLSMITRKSQIWMLGDVGAAVSANSPRDGVYAPSQAFWPENATKPNLGVGINSPALRHRGKADVCFWDGHIESVGQTDLQNNTHDIFAIDSL